MPLQLTTLTNPGTAQWTVARSNTDPGLVALPADLFVNNITGSDVTGTGTLANPWATLAHAMLQLPVLADHARTIHIEASPTPYIVASRTLWAFNRCTMKGELTNDGQGTLTSTPGTGGTEATGTNVEVLGAGWAVDEHVGKFILWVTGGLAGRFGVVYQNDADTLFVTTQNTSYTAPAAGDTFDLMVHGSSIEFQAETVDNGQTDASNHNLRYEDVSINANAAGFSTWAVACLARVNFRRCSFGQNIASITIADGARARLQTCYVDTLGQAFAERGVIQCGSNGSMELFQGCVVDARFSTSVSPAQSGITCKGASSPQWQGELVIRGLGTMGYNMEGCIAGTNDNAGTMNLVRFIDCQRGFIINGNTEEGGGYYGLPDLYGNVTGDYVVTAQHAARVTIGTSWPTPGGAAVSALGPMAISANNGSSQSSWSEDGTLISGGSPAGGESADPGNGNIIPTTLQGVIPLRYAGAGETNTFAAPFRPGQQVTLVADSVAVGSRAVTFAAAINVAGDTIATFTGNGQTLSVVGVTLAGVPTWRVLVNDGATLS